MRSKGNNRKAPKEEPLEAPPSVREHGELTKAEWLERQVWTLQFEFERLLKEDIELATQFLRWGIDQWGTKTESIRREIPNE